MSGNGRLPLVAIPLRPEARDGVPPRQFQNRVYFEAVEEAGGVVLPVPLTNNMDRLRALYDRCDAVCLPGGPDVVPQLYGETPREDCGLHLSPELDAVDLELARWAVEDDKPLLAICRGMQVLNVALGGTLWQDLDRQVSGAIAHRHGGDRHETVHSIGIEPGSRLHGVVDGDTVDVNSLHHQGVRDIAPRLRATAYSPDGLVEGVEHEDRRFAVGLQCHPEELFQLHPWAARLFHDFVESAEESAPDHRNFSAK
ncbi:MAG: gamma-glutamyl-gamma-aminobutyrate hydrolase family protein [Candidatus Dormibacteria bacterium]